MEKDFIYITTSIAYVNAKPHIGFALESIQADVLARAKRMVGNEVFFNFGTDEHGLKRYKNGHKCRCPECRAANALYERERRRAAKGSTAC